MNKQRPIFWVALSLFLLLMVTIPVAGQGGWIKRVSGGMSESDDFPLTISLNAWQNADSTFGGQGFFYLPGTPKKFRIEVTKICTGEVPTGTGLDYAGQEYAVVVGKLFGLGGAEVEGGLDYVGIAIVEGGTEKDAVRFGVELQFGVIDSFCETTILFQGDPYLFPHEVVEGNFNIRIR